MPTRNKVLRSTRVTAHCSFFFFQYVCAQSLSHAQLFVTTWTVARQVPLSMEFPRQEYWIGLSFSTPFLVWEFNVFLNDLGTFVLAIFCLVWVFFNWNTADLQCFGFRYTVKCFSYTYIDIYMYIFFFTISSIIDYYKIFNIVPWDIL